MWITEFVFSNRILGDIIQKEEKRRRRMENRMKFEIVQYHYLLNE